MTRMGLGGARLILLLTALLAAGSVPALAATPKTVEAWKQQLPFNLTGEIEGGAQIVDNNGQDSYVFDEYRDMDTMGTASFYLLGEDKQRRGYIEMGGSNMTRMDAYYFLNGGRYNYYRFFFEFDRIPHTLANNARTIYDETSSGVFRVRTAGGVTPAILAGALNAAASPVTPAARQAIIEAVNPLLGDTKLGFQTDTARMGGSWLIRPDLELGLSYAMTIRDGRVPLGTVIGSPGGNVLELAIPRDERYHEMKAGLEFARDAYQIRFNYTFSAFENEVDSIEWENPCGAGAVGCANASGLGRYSTMPDNFAHTVSLAGGYSLPWWSTRFTLAGSYGFWRQDENFLPYHTATTANTTDAGDSSTDATMHVGQLNAGITTRPLRDVTARFRYRLYDVQNDMPHHTFTDVLSAGGDITPVGTSLHQAEPFEFRKQNATADLSWRVFRPLTLRTGYEYERWDRPHEMREVSDTNEHILKAGADIQPWSWLQARLTYSHGVRTIGSGEYLPHGGNADSLPQFRKFDEADRTRDKGEVMVQVSPLDTLTLSGSFYAQNDGYWNTDFGLHHAQAIGFSGDVSWAPTERLALFAGYARDIYRSKQRNCFISRSPVGGAIPPAADGRDIDGSACHPLNIFFVNPKDTLDTVNVGANVTIMPSRLDLSLGYRFAFGRSEYVLKSVPGDGPDVTNPGASEPGDVPEVENRFHIFNVVVRYFLTQNWVFKLGYQYERYEEKDFTTDAIQPALADVPGSASAADARSIVLGATHPPYEAHIVALSVGFRF